MLQIMLFISGWLSPTESISLTGDIAYYPEGLMPQVAETRGISLDGYDGGLATMSCGDRFRKAWLEVKGKVVSLLVVDCSNRNHYQMNVERGRIGDIGYRLWEKLGLPNRPFPARIWFVPPPSLFRFGVHVPI